MKFLSERTIVLVSLIALVTVNALAQSVGPRPPIGGYRSPSEDPNVGRRDAPKPQIGEPGHRPMANSTGPVFKSERDLNAKERMLLATYPEDQKKYARFLSQPETGLFRLLSHESRGIVTVETLKSANVILPIKGRGSYYSYSKLRHDLDGWSEIGLQNGTFRAGFAPRALGFMVLLGDVPLETVTPDRREVAYLHKLVPATTYQNVMALGRGSVPAFHEGGMVYCSELDALVNNTYVLRSTISGKADLLVAFRVIRQDDDGSLHILWKKLASYRVTTLKGRPKKQPAP